MRAGIVLLAAAASLAAGMVAVGVVAEMALESSLAETYNGDVDWQTGQRVVLGADIAATLVLTVLTLVVVFAARRVTADRGRVIAGALALALVFACALPSAGWFWLVAQDGSASDKEFILDAYGRWYFPVVGAFGAAFALAAAGAAILFLLPGRRHPLTAPASGGGWPTTPFATTGWPASTSTGDFPTPPLGTDVYPGGWPASTSFTEPPGPTGFSEPPGSTGLGGDWPADGQRLQ